jgi:feruloyl esterase
VINQVNSVREVYQPLANILGYIVYPSFGLGAPTSVFSANTKVVDRTTIPQLSNSLVDDF